MELTTEWKIRFSGFVSSRENRNFRLGESAPMRKGIRLRSRNWRLLEARLMELTTGVLKAYPPSPLSVFAGCMVKECILCGLVALHRPGEEQSLRS